jgi:hypothetical protein
MVRPHPARLSVALVERSAREGTTPPGTGWPNPVNQARAFTAGSASIHCRPLLGGAQGNSRSTAHRAPLYFRAIVSPSGHGRIPVSVRSRIGGVLSIPCRWLDAHPLTGARSPALTYMQCGHPAPTTAGSTAGPGSFGHRSCAVFAVSLSHVAGCLQDDAPVRRASRLRTTSDGVRCAH